MICFDQVVTKLGGPNRNKDLLPRSGVLFQAADKRRV